MQIDFHHGVTYVVARLAGFNKEEAGIIAHSSQQVDDATEDELINFPNGQTYKPLCSAHKQIDIRNFDNLLDSYVWKSFHFLPGNKVYGNIDSNLKFICKPNSSVAKEMINECLRKHDAPYSLYRLGITMHVYADTWAHQGFSGIQDDHNRVIYIKDDDNSADLINKAKKFFQNLFDPELSELVGWVLPLGHGPALNFPDLPYLKWQYKSYDGRVIFRDNSDIFLQAVIHMYSALKSFKQNNLILTNYTLNQSQIELFKKLFNQLDDEDGMDRHKKWLEEIRQDAFGFGKEDVEYIYTNANQWDYDQFVKSDWYKFHEALNAHYTYVTKTLFPKFNI